MKGRSVVFGATYWIVVCAIRCHGRKIPHVFKATPSSEVKPRQTGETQKARFREKFLSITVKNPYRKPTQVIRSSRPRRTREMSSRNSAKKQPKLRDKAWPNFIYGGATKTS